MLMRNLSAAALTALLCVSCAAEPPKPAPKAPQIISFAPEQAELAPGESTRLVFSTSGADEVEVLDASGAPLAVEGSASSGSVTVKPPETSIYVLRATGVGGRTTAFTQVTVGDALASVFLAAVPPEADPGENVELVWSAQGAKSVSLTDPSGATLASSGERGVVTLTPTESGTYKLAATGPDGVVKEATAEVLIRPSIEELTASPGLVRAGEVLHFQWRTKGATSLRIVEATFGELYQSASADDAQLDNFDWTVPTEHPVTMAPLLDGYRLEFTVTVQSDRPATTLTRTFVRHLNQGPVINAFLAPESATPGRDLPLSWTVTGAERVQLFANGLLVAEPRLTGTSDEQSGSVRLPAPTILTRYRLEVRGFDGATASATRDVSVVAPPAITGFNVSANIDIAGDAATATWTTQDATQVQIRVKNGPVVYSTSELDDVESGTTTLYPGRTTTFVLDAINAAGDQVSEERTVIVYDPADITLTPAHPVPGNTVTLAWDLPVGDVTEVLGVPHPAPQAIQMSGMFWDLAKEPNPGQATFVSGDDGVFELPASLAFRYPFVGSLRSRFFVSTNGFVALEPTAALPQNVTLPTEAAVPAMLAPLWRDLVVGSGRVLYQVIGTEFPRRLIVQWDEVEIKDAPGSKLTFQVQLAETGEARFVYQILNDGAGGDAELGATIGVHESKRFSHPQAATGPAVDEGTELLWFTSVNPQDSFSLALESTTRFPLFWRRLDGTLVSVGVPVTVWGQDALSVREAMPLPVMSTNSQWLELVNTTSDEMLLDGVELQIGSLPQPLPLDTGVVLAPGEALVVGQSDDPLQNGGVEVDLVLPGLSLAAQDSILVTQDGVTLSSLEWTAPTIAESVVRPQRVIFASGAEKVCAPTLPFGMDGAKGTPGAPNEPCWDYLLEPIAYDPVDIRGSGAQLFGPNHTGRKWVELPLATPFPLFETSYEQALFSANGFISFVNTPGTVSDYYSYGAEKLPRFTAPNASVVPMGDAFELLDGQRPHTGVFLRRVEAGERGPGSVGHVVMLWFEGANLSDDDVNVTFQAKLFDDGVIEFHYGRMLNGTHKTIAYGEGEDATTWLENATGSEALAINVFSRTPGLHSFTAFRFTPAK